MPKATTNRQDDTGATKRSTVGVFALCWVAIIFDGYDLIVYGTVIPSLLAEPSWNLSPAEAGRIASWTLVGMLVGALTVGSITDIVGRRRIMIACIVFFSVMMGLCALATGPEMLAILRFLAGLGLGGVVPTASALTMEYARAERRHLTYALMFSGYPIGGVLAAALALEVIPNAGWQTMFAFGVAPLFLVVPLCLRFLPESPAFLMARGRHEEAETLIAAYGLEDPSELAGSEHEDHGLSAVRLLFARYYLTATLLFWGASFMGLLLIYGLYTWLPQIMREAGYDLGSALSFLLALNLGAVVGTAAAAWVADRRGLKLVTVATFLAATLSVGALAFEPSSAQIYGLLAVAGVGTIGTQILVNSYVGSYYPARARATALGWSLGVGRLGAIVGPTLGGYLLESDLGIDVNFWVYSAVGLVGAVLISFVPRRTDEAGLGAPGSSPAHPLGETLPSPLGQ
jgi:AAHS family benzoate transporter-like MFS transporter